MSGTIFQHALPNVIEANEIKYIFLLMILFILINRPHINHMALLGETRCSGFLLGAG